MINGIIAHWQENRGNWLLAMAVAVCVLASISFYLGWLPEIRLRPPAETRRVVASRGAGVVAVTVITPKPPPGTRPRIIVGLLEPYGRLAPATSFLFREELELPANGVLTAVFPSVPVGDYAAVAFVDRNQNGRLDFQENGNPSEPFRLSFSAADPPEDQLHLSEAAFAVERGQPVVLTLDFTQPVHTGSPTAPDASSN
ncbi:MAG: DUF2141 domain-containing protein [Planctomycetota bacterium]|nr:MAG: DUF2141 domain-containing protein [Planctomycetota bacterium]